MRNASTKNCLSGLKEFSLEVEPTKTKLVAFGSQQLTNKQAQTFQFSAHVGQLVEQSWPLLSSGRIALIFKWLRRGTPNLRGRAPPVARHEPSFLGLTHYVTQSRKGSFKIGRKTEKTRMQKKLKAVSLKLKRLRIAGVAQMVLYLRQHLAGHIQYYGVSENTASLSVYIHHVRALLFKWMNRRSQRKSCTWEVFGRWWESLAMPRPRIVHSFYTFSAPSSK